jgi:transcriptional regulator with XRE-family HTH domain
MSIFSERLKALRLEYGLSLNDVAIKCGTSKSSIHLYELGTRKPKREVLEELSCLFGVDIDYLTGRSDIKNAAANLLGYSSLEEAYNAGADLSVLLKQTAPTKPELSEGKRKLIEFAESVPEGKIDLVLRVMQSIVEAD